MSDKDILCNSGYKLNPGSCKERIDQSIQQFRCTATFFSFTVFDEFLLSSWAASASISDKR